MINIKIVILFLLHSFACKTPILPEYETESIKNAKWYFYSYAVHEKYTCYYNRTVSSILECDIYVKKTLKEGTDTVDYSFGIIYQNDSVMCNSKPFNIYGTMEVKNGKYLPLLHQIALEPLKDSTVFKMMEFGDSVLKKELLNKNIKINPWLLKEAERRGAIKKDSD